MEQNENYSRIELTRTPEVHEDSDAVHPHKDQADVGGEDKKSADGTSLY